jgi:hypothetical protein
MMIFRKAVPRRTFLRGTGVALTLPLLDAMTPAFAATPATPLRAVFVYGPNGKILKRWTPAKQGADYEMTPSLEPLAKFRQDMLLVSGLNIKAADMRPGEDGSGHARSSAAFLTGIHPKPDGALGASADQIMAREFAKDTQFASLELGMEAPDIDGRADGSYKESYTSTICWRTGTQPLPIETNPRKVFDRLLGSSGSTDAAARQQAISKSRSLLDFIREETSSFSAELGAADNVKLTEYLDSVRDIERRIQLAEKQAGKQLPEIARPNGLSLPYSEQAKMLFDLQTLALQTDLTRMITFMFGLESGEGNYHELGITEGHHALSHHSNYPEPIAACEKIDVFHSQLLAYFADKLKSTPDGDGSLLDHSLVIHGCGLDDGMLHTHNGIPILMMGAKGKIRTGQHLVYKGDPLSNLWLTVFDLAGVPEGNYRDHEDSDATGRLEGVTI